VNGLTVREGDDGERDRNDDPDWRHQTERGDAADQQHAQDFLRGVGDGGERVGGENRQSGDPGEAFVMGVARGNGRADDQALDLSEK
jgi:hypothetical protein